MKRYLSFLLCCSFLLSLFPAAQAEIIVEGKVLDKKSHKPIQNRVVTVYVFLSFEAAKYTWENAKKSQAASSIGVGNSSVEVPAVTCEEETGFFSIEDAPEDGALLIRVQDSFKDPKIVRINNQRNLGIIEVDAGEENYLENVDKVLDKERRTPPVAVPICLAGRIEVQNTIPVPERDGQTNARLIYQPFVVDCSNDSIVQFRRPRVFQGEEYYKTMDRWLSYKPEKDPLYPYLEQQRLSDKGFDIMMSDTVVFDNKGEEEEHSYRYRAVRRVVDYQDIIFDDTLNVSTCECVKPFQFLQMNLPIVKLDFKKYYERPRRELRNTEENVQLTFLIGKAEIDPSNPENTVQLAKLNEALQKIVSSREATLKALEIEGVSSPEGSLQTNQTLSNARAQYALNAISSRLPEKQMYYVKRKSKGEVAPWSDVVPLLRDSFPEVAQVVQNVVERTVGQEEQGRIIQSLPEYEIVKRVLPHLRKVVCKYQQEIFRNLTPEEILEKYENEPNYRNGVDPIPVYEYWHLFQLIKEPKELLTLYKRAYKETKEERGAPWALAANLWAGDCIRKDSFDVSILEPLIDVNFPADFTLTTDGRKKLINPAPVVANQVTMYLRADRIGDAGILTQNLPKDDAQYDIFRAFTQVLLGHFREEEDAPIVRMVAASSPRNAVIMSLATNKQYDNEEAERLWAKLDMNDGVTWYLKAIIENRKFKNDKDNFFALQEAEEALLRAWSLDPSLVSKADSDGEFIVEGESNPPEKSALRKWQAEHPVNNVE